MQLSSALKRASAKIWNELTPLIDSSHQIYEIREEGLTSMALKELSNSRCRRIGAIKMISAKQENQDGYDFQLSIGSDRTNEYVNFFIQAKRLTGNSIDSKYSAIKDKQITDLISYSRRKGVPVFALFNHLQERTGTLRSHYNSISSFNRKYLGITLVSAHSINKVRNYEFSSIHKGLGPNQPRKNYSPANLANVFGYYKNRMNLAVPFHELAYFNIELAKKINAKWKDINRKSTLPLLLLLTGFEDFIFGNENLIPIMSTNSQQLIADFVQPVSNNLELSFQPQALIIINT